LAKGFGWGVNTDEDDIRLSDVTADLSRKEEVPVLDTTNKLLQPRFIDRQLIGLPGSDTGFVDVDHYDPVLRAIVGDYSHGWPSNITGTYTENVCQWTPSWLLSAPQGHVRAFCSARHGVDSRWLGGFRSHDYCSTTMFE
jgi:hypothetical protein